MTWISESSGCDFGVWLFLPLYLFLLGETLQMQEEIAIETLRPCVTPEEHLRTILARSVSPVLYSQCCGKGVVAVSGR